MNDEQKPAKRYRGANKQPTMVYVSVRIPKDVLQWLKEKAQNDNTKLSDAIRATLKQSIQQENNDAV
jgi:uncharacterized protein (DUF4415 family)